MIEVLLSALNMDFPNGLNKIDVSSESCKYIDRDYLEKLDGQEIMARKRTQTHKENVIFRFYRQSSPFSDKELRIILSDKSAGKCQAYLFKHAF